MIKGKKTEQYYGRYCHALICSLILMYGCVPFVVNFVGQRDIDWAYANFIGSVSLLLAYMLSVKIGKRLSCPNFGLIPKFPVTNFTVIFIFLIALVIFYLFPWHYDRVSTGSKFSAVMRAIWLYVIFSLYSSTETKRSIVLFLTIILMYVDQSRTSFMLGIFYLAMISRYTLALLPIGIILSVFLASVRMSKSMDLISGLWFGIFGEAYNGAYAVSQLEGIQLTLAESINYSLQLIFQPAVYVITKFVGFISYDVYQFTSQRLLIDAVREVTSERLSPLGGWYLPASFIHLGTSSIFIMFLYLISIFYFTKMLFYSHQFPYHLLLMFIAVKATPAIYVNYCIYFALVFFIMNAARKVRVKT